MLDSYSRMTMKNIYKKVNKISVKDKKSNKSKKNKEEDYTVIRKFNNDGPSFQKVMEEILIRKLNELDKK
jgi:hypothetical protein